MAKQERENPTTDVIEESATNLDNAVSDDEITETPTQNEPENISVVGKVAGCVRLNVRKSPRTDAEVLCEVSNNSELLIDTDQSTDKWFKVCTAAGTEGFCMKKYVAVQK